MENEKTVNDIKRELKEKVSDSLKKILHCDDDFINFILEPETDDASKYVFMSAVKIIGLVFARELIGSIFGCFGYEKNGEYAEIWAREQANTVFTKEELEKRARDCMQADLSGKCSIEQEDWERKISDEKYNAFNKFYEKLLSHNSDKLKNDYEKAVGELKELEKSHDLKAKLNDIANAIKGS